MLNLYYVIADGIFVRSLTDPRQVTTVPMPAQDSVPVSIFVVQRDTLDEAFSVTDLDACENLIFAGVENIGDTNSMFYEDAFLQTASGDPYVADVDLNTAVLIAALGTNDRLAIPAQLTVQITATLANTESARLRIMIVGAAITSGLTPSPSNNGPRIDANGDLWLYNDVTAEYHKLELNGAEGQTTVRVGQTGDADP